MIAIILAAGYATRLSELAKQKPKHLLKVGRMLVIDHVMASIETLPVSDVFLVTNNKFYDQFVEWSKGLSTDINVNILNDGTQSNQERLGIVGDICYAIKAGDINDDLFIAGGDNLYYEQGAGYNLMPLYNTFKKLGKGVGVLGLYDIGSLELAKQMGQASFINEAEPLPGKSAQIKKIVEKAQNPKSTLVATMLECYPRSIIRCLKDKVQVEIDFNKQAGLNYNKIGGLKGWLIKERKIPVYGYYLTGQWFDVGSPIVLKIAREYFSKL